MSDAFPDLNPASEPSTAAPAASGAADATDATATSDAPAATKAPAASGATAVPPARKSRPLFGTIFWGVVLLTFAALMALSTLFPLNLDPTLWLVGSVIAIGLLLVVAGIAAASRRAG